MQRGIGEKRAVLALVERGGRSARSMEQIDRQDGPRSPRHQRGSQVASDDRRKPLYKDVGKEFARHFTVNHAKGEYATGFVHTNTVEGYFSIFKRGMIGTYQHCGEQHLQRYLSEFDFRYSNRKISDKERAEVAVKGAEGKRLMYRRSRLSA